jgi:hypothetical protein
MQAQVQVIIGVFRRAVALKRLRERRRRLEVRCGHRCLESWTCALYFCIYVYVYYYMYMHVCIHVHAHIYVRIIAMCVGGYCFFRMKENRKCISLC